MQNKKWKEFKRLTRDFYLLIAGAQTNHGCWNKAFDVLKEIIADERSKQAEYALELYQLDEITDYEYDVQGWLEDYLDELDMCEEHDRLLEVCNVLLAMFQWEEDDNIVAVTANIYANLPVRNMEEDFLWDDEDLPFH